MRAHLAGRKRLLGPVTSREGQTTSQHSNRKKMEGGIYQVVVVILVGIGGKAVEGVCVLERLILVHVLNDLWWKGSFRLTIAKRTKRSVNPSCTTLKFVAARHHDQIAMLPDHERSSFPHTGGAIKSSHQSL